MIRALAITFDMAPAPAEAPVSARRAFGGELAAALDTPVGAALAARSPGAVPELDGAHDPQAAALQAPGASSERPWASDVAVASGDALEARPGGIRTTIGLAARTLSGDLVCVLDGTVGALSEGAELAAAVVDLLRRLSETPELVDADRALEAAEILTWSEPRAEEDDEGERVEGPATGLLDLALSGAPGGPASDVQGEPDASGPTSPAGRPFGADAAEVAGRELSKSHAHLVFDDGGERMVMTVALRGTRVQVMLRGGSSETRDTLLTNAGLLEDALRRQGLELLDVDGDSERDAGPRSSRQDSERRRASARRRHQGKETP